MNDAPPQAIIRRETLERLLNDLVAHYLELVAKHPDRTSEQCKSRAVRDALNSLTYTYPDDEEASDE